MSGKDYIAIAAAIKLARGVNDSRGHNSGVYDVARILAETLALDNSRARRRKALRDARPTMHTVRV
jgi:hypothetical protein